MSLAALLHPAPRELGNGVRQAPPLPERKLGMVVVEIALGVFIGILATVLVACAGVVVAADALRHRPPRAR